MFRSRLRKPRLVFRARMIQAIRTFFIERDFLEVETPHLLPALAPEFHIRPVRAENAFLQTSPELCMKRLLSAGYGNIFQMTRAFRKGERGKYHLPEFSLLEWYRIHVDYRALMTDCEDLLRHLARCLELGDAVHYLDRAIDVSAPFDRLSVEAAFHRYSPVSLKKAMASGRFDDLLAQYVEPNLGRIRPTVLYDYPAPLAALARLKAEDRDVAERFELYMGGIELANGFSELNDPVEQQARFQEEREKITATGKTPTPMPDKFLSALAHMPQAAGIALGLDRLAMVLSGADKIDEVVAFTPEEV
ncbi:MAG: EF-P lysine aminoacylase EpmA [Deltaproteobacteria bacterium]